MNLSNVVSKLSLFAAVTAIAAATSPSAARADATCTNLLNAKRSQLTQYSGWYYLELVNTKDPLGDVTYSTGTIGLDGSWGFYGTANLEFSDRWNGSQNFNINAVEQVQIWISNSGQIWIYNNNYHYYIVSGQDMSCTGGLMTAYVSGLGQVTFAFRNWNPPIQ